MYTHNVKYTRLLIFLDSARDNFVFVLKTARSVQEFRLFQSRRAQVDCALFNSDVVAIKYI